MASEERLGREGTHEGADNAAVAVTLQRVGLLYMQAAQYEEAITTFREGLDMSRRMYGENRSPSIDYEIGLAFRETDQLDSALTHAETAARLARETLPDDDLSRARMLYGLAAVRWVRDELAQAAEVQREGLDVSTRAVAGPAAQSPDAVLGLMSQWGTYGALLRGLSRNADAGVADMNVLRLFQAARANGVLGSDAAPSRLNRACWLLSLSGFGTEALPVCDEAVAKSDSTVRPMVLDSRAFARAVAGDTEGAIEDFDGYLARFPNDPNRRRFADVLRSGRNPFTRRFLDGMMMP